MINEMFPFYIMDNDIVGKLDMIFHQDWPYEFSVEINQAVGTRKFKYELNKFVQWTIKNIGEPFRVWIISSTAYVDTGTKTQIKFLFKHREDLIAFKLRFG